MPVHGALAQHQLGGDGLVRSPGRDQAQAPAARVGSAHGVRARCAAGKVSSRARSGAAPSSLNALRAASSSHAAPSWSPSTRHASPSSTRARAQSYGASTCCHSWHARRSAVAAGPASPSARSTAPRADAAIAASTGPPNPSAISASSTDAPLRELHVADGQHDLHVRRQQLGALEPARRRVEGTRDRGGGGVGASLGQPQQGQTRLGLPTPLARAAERLLRLGELPQQPMDLALPVERRRRRVLVRAAREAFGRAANLGERVLPRPASLHELGAVHQALAGEVDHVRLLVAPASQRRGPLRGPPQLVQLAAGVDHPAVHQAGHQRRGQLPGHHGDHRLVQQGEALGYPVRPDQRISPEQAVPPRQGRRRRSVRRSPACRPRWRQAPPSRRPRSVPMRPVPVGTRARRSPAPPARAVAAPD